MADQEQVEFTIDPRSVTQALGQMNNAITSYEKGAMGANERLNNSFQRVSDLLLKVNDRSYNSQERLVKSIERQAAAYGRSGIEKLVAQRDAYIKRLGDEESQIKRVTAAYEKMIKAEGAGGEHGAAQKGFLAAKDLFEGRNAYASVEAGKTLLALQGIPAVAGAAAASIGLVTLAGYEFAKSLSEWGVQMNDVQQRTGLTADQLGKFDFATKAAGKDLTAVESTMRGLATAVEDTSTKGEAGRQWLAKWGVDAAQVRAGNADTADTLQKIAAGLAALPPGVERSKAALDVFKRAGIENIPWLVELNENLDKANAQGLGFKQSDIDSARRMKEELALFDRQWDDTMRKLKQPLALGVVGALGLAMEGLGRIKDFLDSHPLVAQFLIGVPTKGAQNPADQFKDMGGLSVPQLGPVLQRGIGRENSEVDAALQRWGRTKEGLQAALTEAKKNETQALDDLRKHDRTQMGAGPAEIAALTQASAKVAGLESQIKAAAKAESELLSNLEAIRKVTEEQAIKTKYPNGLLPAEQKVLEFTARPGVTQGQVNQFSDVLLPERTKESQDAIAKGLARGRDEARRASGLVDQTPQTAEDLTRRLREQSAAADRDFLAGLARENKQLESDIKASTAVIIDDRASQLKQAEGSIKVGGILNDRTPQQQLATEARLLSARKSALDDEFRYERDLVEAKYKYDDSLEDRRLELRLKHASDVADLEMQLAERVAQEQRRQFDTIQKDAESLFTTLFTRPAEFGKQLASTVKAAFLKPITEGLSNTVAAGLQPLIYGRDGNGGLAGSMKGLFGGVSSTDPIKASTDLLKGSTDINSGATDRNTDELRRLTEAIGRQQNSRPGSGSGGGGGGGFFGGFPSFARSAALGAASFAGIGSLALPAFAGAPALTPQITSTLGGSDMEGLSGRGGFEGIAGGVPYDSSSPFAGNPAGALGIGGTAGFTGGAGGASFIPAALRSVLAGGGSQGGGLFQSGGFGKYLSGLKSNFWNENINTGSGQAVAASSMGFGGKLAGALTSPGAAALMTGVGVPLTMAGLTGSRRGTWGGIAESTGGGALVGAGIGTMILPGIGTAIGAGIGAAAGFVAGGLEKLFGVESPENKAIRLIKDAYRIDVNKQMAQQVVQIANSKYGSNINVAVHSPEVRQMMGLYAQGTGQGSKFPLSAATPTGASFSEIGGKLFQEQTYQYGVGRVQQSSLPVAGGGNPSVYPSPQSVTLVVNGQSAADLLDGRVANTVNPAFVQDRFAQAQASSNGRLANSAMVQAPGLVFG